MIAGAALARALHRGNAGGAEVAGALALAVSALGLLWPKAVRPIFIGVIALTRPIGAIVSTGLLALVYDAVITPLAIVFRLVGRDALSRRTAGRASTYWRPRAKPSDLRRYFRQS